MAITNGLINVNFSIDEFEESFSISSNTFSLFNPKYSERIAQIIADFLRDYFLRNKIYFSSETVFSHKSKIDIIKKAVENGFKVYLYFVCTESPLINIERVKARVQKGGHHVPEDKIIKRYYNSLELMKEASQLCYQAYFFDNTVSSNLIAHFKMIDGKRIWDKIPKENQAFWFKKYFPIN